MSRAAAVVALLALAAAGCGGAKKAQGPLPAAPATIELTSPAFAPGGAIPRRFTCDGDDVSPPLHWSGVPSRARELALLVEDPDAPGGTFVHWTVLGLGARVQALAPGRLPPGVVQTDNGFGHRRYDGPCPPKGDPAHHYVFSLYAVSRRLGLKTDASAEDVRSALRGAALARGRLTGRYRP